MLSSTKLLVLGVQVLTLGVSAMEFDWVDGLPSCWQNCLKDAGCDSQKCICESSANRKTFLPGAVSCAASKCDADDWAVDLALLGPLDLYCGALDCAVPEEIMSSARVAVTATTAMPAASTTKPSKPKSTSSADDSDSDSDDDALKTTVTTTLTHTTTDDEGHTLEVIVPIVMGPSTISTGKTVTSTLGSEDASSTPAPSSAAAIPTDNAPPPTQAQQAPEPTQTSKSKPNAQGNGSPFENMQAGAGQWGVSGVLVSAGVLVAGLFMTL